MTNPSKHWYALYTRSRAEKKVAKLLEENGTEIYLPLQKTMKLWSDRRKTVYEPLFRSYVFVRCGKFDFEKVLKIPGAVRFVTFTGEKVIVPDYQIEAVRTYLGEQALPQSLEYFKTGNQVEVAYGSLKGLRGRLVNDKNQRKLTIQIEAVNQNITLILPAYLLRKIRPFSA